MAIFGAPEHYADHPARAVRAALAIRAIAEELDRSGAFAGLRIGVGVHRGDVVVGDIGGERQREYTAIGDAVNVASRVEGATKELGEDVLITSAVAERVAGLFTLRPHGAVALRGRIDGVGVFGVAALSPEPPELPTAQSAMNHRGPGASPDEPLEAPPAG
jgi:adenylate cyclase